MEEEGVGAPEGAGAEVGVVALVEEDDDVVDVAVGGLDAPPTLELASEDEDDDVEEVEVGVAEEDGVPPTDEADAVDVVVGPP